MKLCQICNKELTKKKHESNARFAKKRFCSAEHARIYMKANGIGWFRNKMKPITTINEIHNP